jgi:excisionase family DNA binding protein
MKIEPAIVLPPATVPEPYINPEDAARFLSISPKTLTRLAREGFVPAHAIGNRARRRWRFLKSELDTWMQGRLHSNHHLRSPEEETH